MTDKAVLAGAELEFLGIETSTVDISLGAERFEEGESVDLEFTVTPGVGTGDGVIAFVLILQSNAPQLKINVELRSVYKGGSGLDPTQPEPWAIFRIFALPALREALLRVQDAVLPTMVRNLEFVPPMQVLRDAVHAREEVAVADKERAQSCPE